MIIWKTDIGPVDSPNASDTQPEGQLQPREALRHAVPHRGLSYVYNSETLACYSDSKSTQRFAYLCHGRQRQMKPLLSTSCEP